jgi:outer membrane protein
MKLQKILLTTTIAIFTVNLSFAEAGAMFLRIGPALVAPNSDSGVVRPLGVEGVKVKDGASLGIAFTYMFNKNLGLEVLGATPFKHDIKSRDALKSVVPGTIADTKQLPPTLTLQYYFDTNGKIRPYIGFGLNYTTFFDSNVKGNLSGLGYDKISLKDSFGLSAQVGLDFNLTDKYFLGISAYYMDINTKATIKGAGLSTLKVDVGIDPWVLMLSGGIRF